jgi:hypothetical protein
MVEILIVGAVTALVVAGLLAGVTDSGNRLWVRTDSQVATLTAAQRAMDRLSEDLGRARQAGLACGQDLLAFDPVGGGARVTYTRDPAGNLVRTPAGGAAQVVGAQLDRFLPICQAGLVRLELVARVLSRYGPATQTLHSQVWVQNP